MSALVSYDYIVSYILKQKNFLIIFNKKKLQNFVPITQVLLIILLNFYLNFIK